MLIIIVIVIINHHRCSYLFLPLYLLVDHLLFLSFSNPFMEARPLRFLASRVASSASPAGGVSGAAIGTATVSAAGNCIAFAPRCFRRNRFMTGKRLETNYNIPHEAKVFVFHVFICWNAHRSNHPPLPPPFLPRPLSDHRQVGAGGRNHVLLSSIIYFLYLPTPF